MSTEDKNDVIESAVAEGGAYETIRKRLVDQGNQLKQQAQILNESRLAEFGGSTLEVAGRVRVRTENNCTARDIVRVGEHLLFGYNVYLGLKKETSIDDVLRLYKLNEENAELDVVAADQSNTFLHDPNFESDFKELYSYYKEAQLLQLVVKNGRLLASFHLGGRLDDIRVFRWRLSPDHSEISYIDNRGERDIALPGLYDFEWISTSRENLVEGRYPHINILDTLFVDTIGGELTIKVEDNTKSGEGIFSEPVQEASQSIDDAEISYAKVGGLILLNVKPYQEKSRYLVFNTRTQQVERIDAIGQSCVQLPEDHGIIYPGGLYLDNGVIKSFNDDREQELRFKRKITSPNGEDVLYIFYKVEEGLSVLYPYNLIDKELKNPIYGHGYGTFEDGRIIVFYAESEPTRIHPMQVWQTPFYSDEYNQEQPAGTGFFAKIGNPELVRGISELYELSKLIFSEEVSANHYNLLSSTIRRLNDQFFWFGDNELTNLQKLLKQILDTSELVLDEYEKVSSIRAQATETLVAAETEQKNLLKGIQPEGWRSPSQFIQALDKFRKQKGHLISIRDYRYIDTNRIDQMEAELNQAQEDLSKATVLFLQKTEALVEYHKEITELQAKADQSDTIKLLTPIVDQLADMSTGLDLLSEIVNGLKIDDATVRTQIIERISEAFSKLNQVKARIEIKRKEMGSSEAVEQFGAQFKLFTQSVTSSLSAATTPEKCDDQLSRLLVQLEELESQFSEYEQFLADILEKRDEVFESFESHKQTLLDAQQRRAQHIADSAQRILNSAQKRAQKFNELDELNTFFASDPLILKGYELVEQLREIGDAIKADDIESKLKLAKDQALRGLRDKQDIFEDGGTVIKLGPRHKFSVNTQELDLTIIPRNDQQYIHISGTDFYEAIENPELEELKEYWALNLESENDEVYRSEYLSYSIIQSAENGDDNLSLDKLHAAVNNEEQLTQLVREYAGPRYKDGYEKGIHDHDAIKILTSLLPMYEKAGLLRYSPRKRSLATLYWGYHQTSETSNDWLVRAKSATKIQQLFGNGEGVELLVTDITEKIVSFNKTYNLEFSDLECTKASEYLVYELSKDRVEFTTTRYAADLSEDLTQHLKISDALKSFENELKSNAEDVGTAWRSAITWLEAFISHKEQDESLHYVSEAAAHLILGNKVKRRLTEFQLRKEVEGLLGSHPKINNQTLAIELDRFFECLDYHCKVTIPNYQRYLAVKQNVVEQNKADLRVSEFKARPLSSFVRNRLINEAYLPLIGDNLAKQMGTVGQSKRSDLMGLLMMISPPGYGKTTLMEYVASRLGLVFMKINCPSVGHDVTSIDPATAPNATARQELEKLNLGLEMGSNVMLYLDDIQHTNPEFLQKFISLCDGTRRIEGVWRGKTKTYDMRGKKFCVVMAGNPYTETGEVFKVPDMLANRADIYNLGDVLSGMDEVFALSYIENSLTSNSVLAPLATRDMSDVYRFFDKATGVEVSSSEFKHPYSGAEINEIVNVLEKMFIIQAVVLKVNQQYILSAAQADKYRTEPSFKLQGSYRNMNKMAEKLSSVMTQDELMQLIDDHYQGESQLLTAGTEENLLKLAELRDTLTDEQQARWSEIRDNFRKQQALGGDDSDPVQQAVLQLINLGDKLGDIEKRFAENSAASANSNPDGLSEALERLDGSLESIQKIATKPTHIEVVNHPVPGIDKLLRALSDTIENSIYPLVKAMDGKLEVDLRTHENIGKVFEQLQNLEKYVEQATRVEKKL